MKTKAEINIRSHLLLQFEIEKIFDFEKESVKFEVQLLSMGN